jgi:glycosyltransferase involved in cell wall biosynthesis
MKIAIDVQTTLGEKTGFGFYVENLVKQYKILDRHDSFKLYAPKNQNDLNAPKRFIWDQIIFPNKAKRDRVDVLHQPCFSAPVIFPGKIVVTIHDLIAIKFGKDIPFFSRQFFGRWMPFSYRYADKIIAISEHTKKDIVNLLKIKQDKIKVIPLATGNEFQKIQDKSTIDRVKHKYHIKGKYLLHIGTLNPRKNLLFLIKVFYQVAKTHRDLSLVITGKKGWYYQELFDMADKLKLKDRIIFTGYIDDCDKPVLYNGASLFVFPSIYEGFGLPPLEAMKCSIPVISSNTSSMPEVLGDAGILLSPYDKNNWVRSINDVLSNAKLRKKLSSLSQKQANKFSWEKTAKETIKIYQQLYHEK